MGGSGSFELVQFVLGILFLPLGLFAALFSGSLAALAPFLTTVHPCSQIPTPQELGT